MYELHEYIFIPSEAESDVVSILLRYRASLKGTEKLLPQVPVIKKRSNPIYLSPKVGLFQRYRVSKVKFVFSFSQICFNNWCIARIFK